MMKIHMLPAFITVVCLLLTAACGKPAPAPSSPAPAAKTPPPPAVPASPASLPGLEDGMLRIQAAPPPGMSDGRPAPAAPTVIDSAKNVRTVAKPSDGSTVILHGGGRTTDRRQHWSKTTPVPADSLAARLTRPSEQAIHWVPLKVKSGIDAVRLADCKLSPDQSLFALVETTGERNGPFGSRIVLLNAHDWSIVKLMETDRRILSVEFVPDTQLLAALCARQVALEQPGGLAVFRLDTGREHGFAILKDGSVSSWLAGPRRKLYLADAQAPRMLEFFAPDLTKSPIEHETDAPGAHLALSPDGKSIAMASGDRIALYTTSGFRPLATVRLTPGYPLAQLQFLDNDKSFLLAADPLRDTVPAVIRAGQVFELKGRSAGFNRVSGDGRRLMIGQKVRGELEFLDAVSLQRLDSVLPESLRPFTSGGDPRFVYMLDKLDALAVLDTRGNFYLLFKPRDARKFQKEIIFTPQD